MASPKTLREYLEEHIDRFQPADYVEMNVVEEMVSATWRLHRAWALLHRTPAPAREAPLIPTPNPHP